MCLKASSIQNAQIEKFVEHGMPTKVIKAVQYTLKKCAKEANSDKDSASDSDYDMEQQALLEQEQKQKNNLIAIADNDKNTPLLLTTMKLNNNSIITNTNINTTAAAAAATTTTATEAATPTTTTTTLTDSMSIIEKATALKIPKLCGRFRQLQQQQHKDVNSNSNSNNNSNNNSNDLNTAKVYVDALSIGTQLTKQFAQRLNDAVDRLQSTKVYTLVTKTTQPAHAMAICILAFVLVTVWPDLVDHNKTELSRKSNGNEHLASIAFLGAFAIHFGAQIWMTFVSGLSLYFSLPRHTFGQCQQILFPKYFALNATLSICMLILYVKYFLSNWENVASCVQLGALIVSAIIEVSIRLYLAPPMLLLMHEKYKIEGAIGSGQEIGTIDQGVLVQCPHYQRIHKSFRRIHMTVAMGNMTILVATCLHLYFLAAKIQIC